LKYQSFFVSLPKFRFKFLPPIFFLTKDFFVVSFTRILSVRPSNQSCQDISDESIGGGKNNQKLGQMIFPTLTKLKGGEFDSRIKNLKKGR
jgi:hypothetical protein